MNVNGKPVLVIGGGIAGMTAALETAEVGLPVVLVEKEAWLGGRVLRSHRYFPKMCPPSCGFEINVRRLRRNPRITVHTLATVERIRREGDGFRAVIVKRPRHVTGGHALDDDLADRIESERPDEFNLGMGTTKALYLPHDMAWPYLHVLDREALSDDDASILEKEAPEGSIDLVIDEEKVEIEAGAVIVATGWRPYDASNLDKLGFGTHPDVVTNVMFERLASPAGPTGGRIVRPSDGEPAMNVAFVQCAGSRDENHLPYCSAVCCMASLKQARYLREQNEEASATLFYIDIRAVGRHETFYRELLDDGKVSFVKGKVAGVRGNGEGLELDVEDTIAGKKVQGSFDLVVLAVGIVPNTADSPIPFELGCDDYGFIDGSTDVEGVYAAGCARKPCDVSRTTKDSTAAAMKAVRHLHRGE